MGKELFRVAMRPLDPTVKPVGLVLDEEQLRDLTSAMNYGSGWFPYRDGEDTTWFNLHGIASVNIESMEGR